MIDSTPPRAWTSICGVLPHRGGAAAANRRLAASSVAPISPNIGAPCVLARLGSRAFATCWVAGRSRSPQARACGWDITATWNQSSSRGRAPGMPSASMHGMTQAALERRIESVLETVQKPSRYIGGEANQVQKPQATAVVALCYPDAYEVGISNQALQILYRQVNARPAMAAERVYCPWPDM